MLDLGSLSTEISPSKVSSCISQGFHLLIQDLINVADETNFQQSDTKVSLYSFYLLCLFIII